MSAIRRITPADSPYCVPSASRAAARRDAPRSRAVPGRDIAHIPCGTSTPGHLRYLLTILRSPGPLPERTCGRRKFAAWLCCLPSELTKRVRHILADLIRWVVRQSCNSINCPSATQSH
jgi:hypothetical protein